MDRLQSFNRQLTENALTVRDTERILSERAQALSTLIDSDPAAALTMALPAGTIEKLRGSFAARPDLLEEVGEWQGPVIAIAEDDFRRGIGWTRFQIRVSGKTHPLYFSGAPPAISCERVWNVRGVRFRDRIVAAGATLVAGIAAPPACISTGEQRLAVLMVSFPSTSLPSGETPDRYRNVLFGPGYTVNGYYTENSFGKVSLTGDVFGPFPLPQDYPGSPCRYDEIADAAIAAADAVVDFTQYQRVAIVYPQIPGCNNGFGTLGCYTRPSPSKGNIFVSTIWYNQLTDDPSISHDRQTLGTFAHEFGHNLLLNHSGALFFPGEALGLPDTGELQPWNDVFTILGANTYLDQGHFNAQQKFFENWFAPQNTQDVEANGTFVLKPIETATTGLQAIRVRRGLTGHEWLWIEYRKAGSIFEPFAGSESVFTGALIHLHDDLAWPQTKLLDFTPETENMFYDAALPSGRTWDDPYSSLSLKVNGIDSSGLSVTVTYRNSVIATPPSLNFVVPLGSTATQTQPLALSSAEPGFAFAVSFTGSWLGGAYVANTIPGTLYVTVNPTNLPVGTYNGSVNLTIPGASNSPLAVPVTLTVTGAAGYWTFDSADITGNTVLDKSGNGLNGVLSNAVSVPGRIGQALSFTGTGSYVAVPDGPGLRLQHDLTLVAWVRTGSVSQPQNFMSKYDYSGAETGYLLQVLPTGVVNLHLGGNNVASGSRDAPDTTPINDGQWHHVAVVIGVGVNPQIYIDGRLSSTPSQTAAAAGTLAPLYLGTFPGAYSGTPFTGSLDEVQVYSRRLSADDIRNMLGRAAPAITRLDPSALPAGTAFTLTVNGTGFTPSAVVVAQVPLSRPTVQNLATTYIGPTQLTAEVPRDFTMGPGTIPFVVYNVNPWLPGAVASDPMSVTVTPVVPTITDIVPNQVQAGGPDFTLTIEGTNFIKSCSCESDPFPGAVVVWNGTPLTITSNVVSSTLLTATVSASAISTPGNITITVQNPGGVASTAKTLAVTSTPPLTINCTQTAGPTRILDMYTNNCMALYGVAPFSWSISAGALPDGLSLTAATGPNTSIQGIPAGPGPYNYTLRLTDSSSPTPKTAARIYSGMVFSHVTVTCTNPRATVQPGVLYTSTCTASGGAPPYQWAIYRNPTPAPSVTYSGSEAFVTILPPAGYVSAFDIGATDTILQQGRQAFFLAVAPTMSCSTPAGPAQVGQAYTDTCAVAFGGPPYTWSISAGTLPTGVTLTYSGDQAMISGAPISPGSYNYTITVQDSQVPPNRVSQPYSGTVYVTTPPSTAPAGYWTFDTADISGNQVLDRSGNGLTGTISNAAPVTGAANQALSFSGTGSYVSVPDAAGLRLTQDLTLAAWIKTGNNSQVQNFLGKYDFSGSETGYLLQVLPSGVINLHLGGNNVVSGGRDAHDTTVLNDGNWHHVAVVITLGQDVKFYVDGSPTSTQPQVAASAGTLSPLYLGTFPGAYNGQPFTGSLDEVRIYPRSLTADEVRAVNGLGAPVITGFDPPTHPQGTAFTLTVYGVGFSSDAKVLVVPQAFNGIPFELRQKAILATTFVNSTQLTAELPRDFDIAPFRITLQVFNGGPGGVGSNIVPYQITPLAPAITGIDPTTVVAGGSAFLLTVNGANFFPSCICLPDPEVGSTIVWNGVPLNLLTNYVSPTQLTVMISADKIATAGTATITVVNTGNIVSTGSRTLTIAATPPPLTLTCTPNAAVPPGTTLYPACTASGGTPPYVWDYSPLAPPHVVSADTRTVTFTVTVSSNYPSENFNVYLRDSSTPAGSLMKNLFFGIGPTLNCIPPTGPSQVGVPYSTTCTLSDPDGVYTWAITAGVLPGGLTLTPAGGAHTSATISGTVLTPGAYSYTVSATDSGTPPYRTSQTFTGTIAVPVSALAGCWPFDTVAGSQTPDCSGNGLNGTVANATQVAGRVNQALSFSGAGSYVTVTNNPGLQLTHNLTLVTWIKTTNTTQTQNFLSKYDFNGSETGYLLQTLPSGGINLHVGGNNLVSGGRDVHDTRAINDGQWHHVAAVVTLGQNVAFYIDGLLSSTQPMQTAAAPNGVPLYIGTYPGAFLGQPFTGSLDEVRIYSVALGANDIAALAAAGGPVPITVTVDPPSVTLGPGQTQPFTATVTGTGNTAVNWTISPMVGNISSTGVYTAPATIAAQQGVTVTAASQADLSKTGQAAITLVPSAAITAAGHWTFDTADISGTQVTDRSGNGLTGTLVNAASIAGKFNQALSFSGAGSYVSVPDSTGLRLTHDLTLAAWIKTANTTDKQSFMSKYDFSGSETGYLLQILPTGRLNLHVGGNNLISGGRDANDTTSINDGQWHHVAVVVSLGQNVKFYIDGQLSSTQPMMTAAAAINAPLYLGTFPGSYNGAAFTGALDDVWVCSRALTPAEIATLAAGGAS